MTGRRSSLIFGRCALEADHSFPRALLALVLLCAFILPFTRCRPRVHVLTFSFTRSTSCLRHLTFSFTCSTSCLRVLTFSSRSRARGLRLVRPERRGGFLWFRCARAPASRWTGRAGQGLRMEADERPWRRSARKVVTRAAGRVRVETCDIRILGIPYRET